MYSERIKKVRETLSISVAKLSKKIGIAERTIVSYESEGRTPSLDFLARLCKELNVNPSWFLFEKGEMFCSDARQDEQLEKLVAQIVDKKMKERGL